MPDHLKHDIMTAPLFAVGILWWLYGADASLSTVSLRWVDYIYDMLTPVINPVYSGCGDLHYMGIHFVHMANCLMYSKKYVKL